MLLITPRQASQHDIEFIMNRVGPALLTAVLALVIVQAPNADPPDMNPDELELHAQPGVFTLFVELFTRGGLASGDQERAAFIVRSADGTYDLQWWNEYDGPRRSEFRGSIPRRAVAVVHTHPLRFPRPSLLDVQEARRIGLPFYILTLTSISVAEPIRGRTREVYRGRWVDREASAVIARISMRQTRIRSRTERTLQASAR